MRFTTLRRSHRAGERDRLRPHLRPRIARRARAAEWQAGIRAGNLYINRPTTGAIVLRQPFGGMGKSCFGPGLKAGGPNYVAQFMAFADRARRAVRRADRQSATCADLRERLRARGDRRAAGGSRRGCSPRWPATTAWRARNSAARTITSACSGEDNFRRYLPLARSPRPRASGRFVFRNLRPRRRRPRRRAVGCR